MTMTMDAPKPIDVTYSRNRNLGAQALVRYAERYECPRCETTIPTANVVRHLPSEDETLAGMRRVSVVCPACRSVYLGRFKLVDGLMQALSIEPVTDAREVRDLHDQVDAKVGTIKVPTQPVREPAAAREPTAREQEVQLLRRASKTLRSQADDLDAMATHKERGLTATRRKPPAPSALEEQLLDEAVAATAKVDRNSSLEPVIDYSVSQIEHEPFDLDQEHAGHRRA
jgi:hypothetical protein